MSYNSNARSNDPNISSFYGIGEGTRITAKANAELLSKQSEEKNMLINALLEIKNKSTATQPVTTNSQTNYTKYLTILVVIGLLAGGAIIYFARKH